MGTNCMYLEHLFEVTTLGTMHATKRRRND